MLTQLNMVIPLEPITSGPVCLHLAESNGALFYLCVCVHAQTHTRLPESHGDIWQPLLGLGQVRVVT